MKKIGQDLWVQTSDEVDGVTWTLHTPHEDERGSFIEWYRASTFSEFAARTPQQVNVSRSIPGVLRGIHYHHHQHDYWFIASGLAQVVVHNRTTSTHESRDLGPGHGVTIPPGIGHGFLALTDLTLLYAVTQEYARHDPDEHGYQPLHSATGIQWRLHDQDIVLSERDQNAPYWESPYE